MVEDTECRWPHLLEPILEELRAFPAGASEFDLIRRLQAREDLDEFPREALRDALSLFRTHFMLFHCLYQLGSKLAAADEDIRVSCLNIQIVRRRTGDGGKLGMSDPMRSFYMDLRNMDDVDASQVERMLGDFWRQMVRDDRRGDALATLELADPVSNDEIKAQYRRLVMQHHPDRGGDKATLQKLNEAMDTLGVR